MYKNKIVTCIIPSRLSSSRFPNKPLAKINGREMVLRVADIAKESKHLDMVMVATPDDSIAKISSASLLGGQYVEIIPGASDIMLKDEETIYNTRDPVSITDLLGQAVFSATN